MLGIEFILFTVKNLIQDRLDRNKSHTRKKGKDLKRAFCYQFLRSAPVSSL